MQNSTDFDRPISQGFESEDLGLQWFSQEDPTAGYRLHDEEN